MSSCNAVSVPAGRSPEFWLAHVTLCFWLQAGVRSSEQLVFVLHVDGDAAAARSVGWRAGSYATSPGLHPGMSRRTAHHGKQVPTSRVTAGTAQGSLMSYAVHHLIIAYWIPRVTYVHLSCVPAFLCRWQKRNLAIFLLLFMHTGWLKI